MAEDLVGIAEELYSLPVAEFTGTRNAWAKQLRADGDGSLAESVTALRKPSTAAWVVNLLVRQDAEQMTQVLELGAALRQAQDTLDADALRDLTRQRRQLTSAVAREGRAIAASLGQVVTEAVARQVEDTLHAAMVDESAAAAVRSGLLVTALSATGVGSLDVADAVAVPDALGMSARRRRPRSAKRPALAVVPEPEPAVDPRAEELRAAQAAVEQAVEVADRAKKKQKKAGRRLADLQARTLQLQEDLEEVRRRAAELEHELEVADEVTEAAEAKLARAGQRYDEAQEALEAAQARLADT